MRAYQKTYTDRNLTMKELTVLMERVKNNPEKARDDDVDIVLQGGWEIIANIWDFFNAMWDFDFADMNFEPLIKMLEAIEEDE